MQPVVVAYGAGRDSTAMSRRTAGLKVVTLIGFERDEVYRLKRADERLAHDRRPYRVCPPLITLTSTLGEES
jgi:hypothetical protein